MKAVASENAFLPPDEMYKKSSGYRWGCVVVVWAILYSIYSFVTTVDLMSRMMSLIINDPWAFVLLGFYMLGDIACIIFYVSYILQKEAWKKRSVPKIWTAVLLYPVVSLLRLLSPLLLASDVFFFDGMWQILEIVCALLVVHIAVMLLDLSDFKWSRNCASESSGKKEKRARVKTVSGRMYIGNGWRSAIGWLAKIASVYALIRSVWTFVKACMYLVDTAGARYNPEYMIYTSAVMIACSVVCVIFYVVYLSGKWEWLHEPLGSFAMLIAYPLSEIIPMLFEQVCFLYGRDYTRLKDGTVMRFEFDGIYWMAVGFAVLVLPEFVLMCVRAFKKRSAGNSQSCPLSDEKQLGQPTFDVDGFMILSDDDRSNYVFAYTEAVRKCAGDEFEEVISKKIEARVRNEYNGKVQALEKQINKLTCELRLERETGALAAQKIVELRERNAALETRVSE